MIKQNRPFSTTLGYTWDDWLRWHLDIFWMASKPPQKRCLSKKKAKTMRHPRSLWNQSTFSARFVQDLSPRGVNRCGVFLGCILRLRAEHMSKVLSYEAIFQKFDHGTWRTWKFEFYGYAPRQSHVKMVRSSFVDMHSVQRNRSKKNSEPTISCLTSTELCWNGLLQAGTSWYDVLCWFSLVTMTTITSPFAVHAMKPGMPLRRRDSQDSLVDSRYFQQGPSCADSLAAAIILQHLSLRLP